VVFERVDLAPPNRLPVTLDVARPSRRRSVLGRGPVTVETPEHLLAALHGLGIADALVLLDGPEVPIVDGSARPFTEALLAVSAPGPTPGALWSVERPWYTTEGRARCAFDPLPRGLALDCHIDYDHPAIGRQRLRFAGLEPALFVEQLAPARTFGLRAEAAALRRQGLALGADPGNVLVFDACRPRDTLRFVDEPVRHKMVDAIGDLALLGAPFRGRLSLTRCGHDLLQTSLKQAVANGALRRRVAP
jgi:UDP-3-O-[3-hydroxymyristoyl] N-acetylglucosamine deacetylase